MIQVFSQKTDKPRHYDFTEIDTAPAANTFGFNPIEFAISQDGKTWISIYDVPDLKGVMCIDTPYIAPAKQTDNYQAFGVQDGKYLLSSAYEQRELKMSLILDDARDRGDTELAFDALQRFMVQRRPYWICFENWPQRMYYVKVSDIAETHLTDKGFIYELTLMDQIGLSRSIGTTGDADYIKGFGNNEANTGESYSFTGSSFTVDNLSDVLIDPERRGHPFKLTIDGASAGKFKLTNSTTGDVFSSDDAFKGQLVLDGVNPTLDGKGYLAKTNNGIITLAIGKNSFTVENFSGKISFDYPMWWLS